MTYFYLLRPFAYANLQLYNIKNIKIKAFRFKLLPYFEKWLLNTSTRLSKPPVEVLSNHLKASTGSATEN